MSAYANESPPASYETELREYEAAHKVWFNTSTFNHGAYERAKAALAIARHKYAIAYKLCHPTHSVI